MWFVTSTKPFMSTSIQMITFVISAKLSTIFLFSAKKERKKRFRFSWVFGAYLTSEEQTCENMLDFENQAHELTNPTL